MEEEEEEELLPHSAGMSDDGSFDSILKPPVSVCLSHCGGEKGAERSLFHSNNDPAPRLPL